VLKVLPACPVVDALDSEVDRFLDKKYYQISSAPVNADDKRVLFEKVPEDLLIVKVVKKEFDVDIAGSDLSNTKEQIVSFISRGKNIKRADLQMIVEKSIRKGGKKTIKVIDFSLNIERNKQPVASIELEHEGEVYKENGYRVGPVDALIKAFQKALSKNNLKLCAD